MFYGTGRQLYLYCNYALESSRISDAERTAAQQLYRNEVGLSVRLPARRAVALRLFASF